MQANVEAMHVGLGQGSKAGEILAEAPQTGAVVCTLGARAHGGPPMEVWSCTGATVEDLGHDTDRGAVKPSTE